MLAGQVLAAPVAGAGSGVLLGDQFVHSSWGWCLSLLSGHGFVLRWYLGEHRWSGFYLCLRCCPAKLSNRRVGVLDRGFRCHCAAQAAAKPRVGCPSWETVPWPDLSTLFQGSLPVGKTRALRRLNIILLSWALGLQRHGRSIMDRCLPLARDWTGVKAGVFSWAWVADSYPDAFNAAAGMLDRTSLRRWFCALHRRRAPLASPGGPGGSPEGLPTMRPELLSSPVSARGVPPV